MSVTLVKPLSLWTFLKSNSCMHWMKCHTLPTVSSGGSLHLSCMGASVIHPYPPGMWCLRGGQDLAGVAEAGGMALLDVEIRVLVSFLMRERTVSAVVHA